MPELERRLAALGAEVDWPPTPDLTVSVMVRLDEPGGEAAEAPAAPAQAAEAPAARARRRLASLLPPAGLRRSLALAAVALLLLAGTVFAAVPSVRDTVLEFFGLQGATVERRETLPQPPPRRSLDLGTRTTLERAAGRVGFVPLVPAVLGQPNAVYVRSELPGGELSLAYRPRAGLPRASSTRLGVLLTEFRGDLSPQYLGKIVGQATSTERLRIGDDRAVWIEGAPHYFFYRAPDGTVVDTEIRLAQNVLLVEHGDLLIRLEGAFDRERAIAVARSLR
jgi:hypothetical protein